jgi:hypothetical protein
MFYEDVTVASGEDLFELITAYGHGFMEWGIIWLDSRNDDLRIKTGGDITKLTSGDVVYIPIPWKLKVDSLSAFSAGSWGGADIVATRTGGEGARLHWMQTVYQSNQPITNTKVFCADACPADDGLPYYYTDSDYAGHAELRTNFYDTPKRPFPSAKQGATAWRAILSIGVVTGKRVTVYDATVWGFDLWPSGTASKVGPRIATATEIRGHLNLMRNGVGTGKKPFLSEGWTFRAPP